MKSFVLFPTKLDTLYCRTRSSCLLRVWAVAPVMGDLSHRMTHSNGVELGKILRIPCVCSCVCVSPTRATAKGKGLFSSLMYVQPCTCGEPSGKVCGAEIKRRCQHYPRELCDNTGSSSQPRLLDEQRQQWVSLWFRQMFQDCLTRTLFVDEKSRPSIFIKLSPGTSD